MISVWNMSDWKTLNIYLLPHLNINKPNDKFGSLNEQVKKETVDTLIISETKKGK